MQHLAGSGGGFLPQRHPRAVVPDADEIPPKAVHPYGRVRMPWHVGADVNISSSCRHHVYFISDYLLEYIEYQPLGRKTTLQHGTKSWIWKFPRRILISLPIYSFNHGQTGGGTRKSFSN